MSVATRRAIYGKLAGDTTLNALLGAPASGYSKSIYYQVAPHGAGLPFVILSKQAGTPRYTFKVGHAFLDEEVWLIKGVGRGDDADPVDNVSSRLDELLTDGVITISAALLLYLRRESDVDYAETVDGVNYRHSGANFRLSYSTT
jgi:hypothetical protein